MYATHQVLFSSIEKRVWIAQFIWSSPTFHFFLTHLTQCSHIGTKIIFTFDVHFLTRPLKSGRRPPAGRRRRRRRTVRSRWWCTSTWTASSCRSACAGGPNCAAGPWWWRTGAPTPNRRAVPAPTASPSSTAIDGERPTSPSGAPTRTPTPPSWRLGWWTSTKRVPCPRSPAVRSFIQYWLQFRFSLNWIRYRCVFLSVVLEQVVTKRVPPASTTECSWAPRWNCARSSPPSLTISRPTKRFLGDPVALLPSFT